MRFEKSVKNEVKWRKPNRQKGRRQQFFNIFRNMKKYVKAEIIAKNACSGSYAAGCPQTNRQFYACSHCELAS